MKVEESLAKQPPVIDFEKIFSTRYEHQELVEINAKQSVSQRKLAEETPMFKGIPELRPQVAYDRPSFMREKKISGAEAGTALHQFMQHLPVMKNHTLESLQQVKERVIEKEMMTEEGLQKAADTCKYLGIDGLICCGGDGTFRGAQALSRKGVPCIGVPGTIDNDIVCTDYTIGFDTACNTAIECIDKLRDTMQSHERCSVVEVMGRRAGHLALQVGCAVGATAICLPERQLDFDVDIVEKMRIGRIKGRNHHIIIVAEGYGSAQEVADQIHEATGIDTRVTILGHIQRGGSPSAMDRVMATRMGYAAVRALMEGKTNRVIVSDANLVTDIDIEEGLARHKDLNQCLFEAQQTVAI